MLLEKLHGASSGAFTGKAAIPGAANLANHHQEMPLPLLGTFSFYWELAPKEAKGENQTNAQLSTLELALRPSPSRTEE